MEMSVGMNMCSENRERRKREMENRKQEIPFSDQKNLIYSDKVNDIFINNNIINHLLN